MEWGEEGYGLCELEEHEGFVRPENVFQSWLKDCDPRGQMDSLETQSWPKGSENDSKEDLEGNSNVNTPRAFATRIFATASELENSDEEESELDGSNQEESELASDGTIRVVRIYD